MRGWLIDLVAATRTLRRAPGFLVLAVATLGIGLGVNAAIFSFVNAVFFKPQPYEEPAQLFDVRFQQRGDGRFSPPTVEASIAALAGNAQAAGYEERSLVVSIENAVPMLVPGAIADATLFDVLGVQPVRGRAFTVDESRAGAPLAVVGDRFARAHWTGEAIGRTLRIDGTDHTVIGVMPAAFSFRDFAEVWVPLGDPEARLVDGNLTLVARFPGDAARERGRQALHALATDGFTARVATGTTPAAGADDPIRLWLSPIQPEADVLVFIILAAVGLVLLIACTNVANLSLARGTARRHELAVRASLGASRARIIRYLTAEGMVTAALAAGLGLLVGAWGTDVLVAWIPMDQLPLWFDASMDVRVLGYIVVLAGAAALVSSTLPALDITRGALALRLNEAGVRSAGDASAGRLRSGLVTVQIALATVLLSGATLLLGALSESRSIDPGFSAGDRVLAIDATRAVPADAVDRLRAMTGSESAPDGSTDRFIAELGTTLTAVPGVERSALVSRMRMQRLRPTLADPPVLARVEAVTADYFATLDLPVLRGRTFDAVEEERADVVLLSERVARDLFDSIDDAIGATVLLDPQEERVTVIGVVNDRRTTGEGGLSGIRVEPYMYVPIRQAEGRDIRILARVAGAGSPDALAPVLSAALRSTFPDVVLRDARSLLEIERDSGAPDLRWFASVFAAFGAFALGLASIGIYGVVAYTVGRRTREIGLRIALGASRTRVAGFVLRSVVPATVVGLAVGTLGAVGLGFLLRSTFLGVAAVDTLALGATVLAFFTITLRAAGLPARRAMRTDPLTALRTD